MTETVLIVNSSAFIVSNLFLLQSILYAPARIILKCYLANINTFLKTSMAPIVFKCKYYKTKDSQMDKYSQSLPLAPQI